MATRQVYNNFFIGVVDELTGTTMNAGCVYLAEDSQEFYGVDMSGNTFLIGSANYESDKTYVYNQGIPSATWTIEHGLEKYPSVIIINSVGNIVEGHIEYVDTNNVILTFSGAFTGDAIFN